MKSAEENIMDLNGVWKFGFAEKKNLHEVKSTEIPLNDWMTVPGCFDMTSSYYCKRGTAFYQREFQLKKNYRNAFLRIDGMGQRSQLYIDGRCIGASALAYSRFELETGPLKAGKHTLCAMVDNTFLPGNDQLFFPYYDFYAFGGFYHGVTLRLMEEDFMIDRIQVRTLDYKTGKVSLRFCFYGNAPENFNAEIRFDTEESSRKYEFRNREIVLNVPEFQNWSPENPHLHTVEVTLNGRTHTETFGIREIRAEKKRIYLNGKDLYLKGFNRHESHTEFGAAVPEQIMLEDLQHLREMNCNFIRGAHYPQSQKFLDLCDRMGFLVWEESLGWGNRPEQAADPEFRSLQIEQTRKMVYNSFNHPSVIIFAFLNENSSDTPELRELDRVLCETIRAEDSGRLVTFACNHVHDDTANEFTDIIAYNTYPGWISNDSMAEPTDDIPDDRDRILNYFRTHFDPEKPVIISEMGTCAIYGEHDPAAAQWTEEFQAEYLDAVIRSTFKCEEIRGLTIWHMNDAKSYLRKGATVRVKPIAQNLAGVYDTFRRAKLAVKTVTDWYGKKKQ